MLMAEKLIITEEVKKQNNMAFKMKRTKATFPYKGEDHGFVHEGDYKIVRKDLDDGILGEAENGKIVNIDVSIPKGSKKEKEVATHEIHHQKEMESGKLSYDDNKSYLTLCPRHATHVLVLDVQGVPLLYLLE